jgi:CBS domain-containing protein
VAAATVADIMDSSPPTVGPDDDVRMVIEILEKHDLQGVTVVDDDNKVVGIVTEEDLVLRDEEGDLHLPHYISLMGGIVFLEPLKGFERRLHKAVASKVSDLMTPDPITISPDKSIKDAAKVIADKHHNRLPVVDDDGKLVGIVTRVDILAALASE